VISDAGKLVDRYDKRKCSHTEVTRYYTPGFEPVVFEVDGFRFGMAICIEINLYLFAEYDRLGVDCLLVSAYPSTRSSRSRPGPTPRPSTVG
jgi:predicted amidohydrolase